MKSNKIKFTMVFILLAVLIFPNNTFAQQEKGNKKKIIIVKKTVDTNGNETVEKIIKEGEEATDFDIEKYIKDNKSAATEIDVDVQVSVNGEKEIDSKEEKSIQVTVEGDNVIIVDGDKKQIIKIDGDKTKSEFNTEDGKHIIIMKSDGENMEDINIEKMGEGGEKEIRIIKKHKKGSGGFLGVMINQEAEGATLLDVVKESPAARSGLMKGDIIQGVNQFEIKNYEELVDVLSKYKPGESIVVLYKRGDTLNKVAITLADAKDMQLEEEKMIWIDDKGTKMEIREGHDVIIEETIEETVDENGNKKVIKKKIIKKTKED